MIALIYHFYRIFPEAYVQYALNDRPTAEYYMQFLRCIQRVELYAVIYVHMPD